jgi:hypothetical protein
MISLVIDSIGANKERQLREQLPFSWRRASEEASLVTALAWAGEEEVVVAVLVPVVAVGGAVLVVEVVVEVVV